MSKAQVGHSALDAEAGVRGDLSRVDGAKPRDERFLRSAIEHMEGQVETLTEQLERVAAKADEVKRANDEKVDEAQAILNAARDELDDLEDELKGLVG